MPVTPTYPGVYIEEIPSGVRTITGVATSIAAFVDFFRRGPMNRAVQLFNFGDFEREFGGLDTQSEASYALQQFFLNGGREAWVVRTASGNPAAARVEIQAAINGSTALTVRAINPGAWGNNLRVRVDAPTPTSADRFNLTISLVTTTNGTPTVVRSEMFRGLSMLAADPNQVERVLNDEFSRSKLVRVTATGTNPPLQNGTLSSVLDPFPALTSTQPALSVTIGTEGTGVAQLGQRPTTLAEARGLLEAAIRVARPASPAFAQASVTISDNRLRILAGPTTASARVTFAAGPDPTVTPSAWRPARAFRASCPATSPRRSRSPAPRWT